jgi:hypothetical protein
LEGLTALSLRRNMHSRHARPRVQTVSWVGHNAASISSSNSKSEGAPTQSSMQNGSVLPRLPDEATSVLFKYRDVRHSGASLRFIWMTVPAKRAGTAHGNTPAHWNK